MKNWRDNPRVMAARKWTKDFDRQAVIVLSFNGENVACTSYGVNGRICKAAQGVAKRIHERLIAGEMDTEALREALEAR